MASESEKRTIIEESDRIIKGIFNLFGSGKVELNPIDWHSDFKTGYRWEPGKFYKNYIQENIATDSDVKVPRELSRCHHLLKLGLAFKLTNNKKYAEVCIAQMVNWINENPLMYSINWGCTMDVAIRAVNWIWSLGLISSSDIGDNNPLEEIATSLYQHGWFIFRNPEKQLYNNHNHYLTDLSGQIHLGLLFENLEEPRKWLTKGKEELFREIRMQILPTGMSYERSTNYNRLVLELILAPILLLKNGGHEIPADIWYRLEKMFEFIMYTLKPDGMSPIIGDQDNGRFLPFGIEENIDFRYLLSLGALIFNRSDFKNNGNGFNVYCSIFGGKKAYDSWKGIPKLEADLESRSFPDAGLYILRDKDNYLLFNATGKGMYPELESGTHTHSDLLSFELYTQGKSFLIDPGTYVYTANADERMKFRSTEMHNTITVDGQSQNNIIREVLWDFSRDAIPQVLKWESDNDKDIITAVHNGYARLEEPVLHERTIVFYKHKEKWEIKDLISGKGFHTVESFFHFDAGIDFNIKDTLVETACADGRNIRLVFEHQPGLILRKEKSSVSKSYGKKDDGYVLVACIKQTVPIVLNIEIMKLKEYETNFYN